MNKTLKFFLALVLLNFDLKIYSQTLGTIDYYIDQSIRSDNVYIMDSASYSNGGITFNYPASYFPNTPRVFVTFELQNRAYSSSEVITAIVTSNSTSSATVKVNISNGTSIFEAANNDVLVHFAAFAEN